MHLYIWIAENEATFIERKEKSFKRQEWKEWKKKNLENKDMVYITYYHKVKESNGTTFVLDLFMDKMVLLESPY